MDYNVKYSNLDGFLGIIWPERGKYAHGRTYLENYEYEQHVKYPEFYSSNRWKRVRESGRRWKRLI